MNIMQQKLIMRNTAIGIVLISAIALAPGCEQEGPAERAGEKIDEAVEKGQNQIEKGAESAGEKIEEAGDAIREKTQ